MLQKVTFVAEIYLCTLVASREFLLHSPKINSISTLSKLEKEHIVANDYFAPNIGNMKQRNRNDKLQINSSPIFIFSNLKSTMFTCLRIKYDKKLNVFSFYSTIYKYNLYLSNVYFLFLLFFNIEITLNIPYKTFKNLKNV